MILKAIRRFYLEDSAGTCGTPMHLLSWSFISRSLIYLLHRWHNSVRFPHTSCYKSQIHYTRTLSINTTDPHRLMCVSTDLYIHRNNHKFVLNFNIYVCVQRERERERAREREREVVKWWWEMELAVGWEKRQHDFGSCGLFVGVGGGGEEGGCCLGKLRNGFGVRAEFFSSSFFVSFNEFCMLNYN